MDWKKLGWGIGAAIVVLLAWAWYDGGVEPVRPIAQEIVLPEFGQ